ncbi:MAG: IS4 family transposase [Opitutaceae bacterium]|nr:IS4 family transposase [Opitutaceae bacterium]
MNPPPTVFAQVLAGLNQMELARAAARFPMPRASRSLSAYDHFAAMVFAQLTYRESLRGIEACLGSRSARAYHMGIRGRVTRTNLAYANEHRDWRVFAEIAAVLMRRARRLYAESPFELGLEADLFALDATVIELSLALCPWARWQKEQASVKLNVLLDLRDDIPIFASLHEGNRHEVASLDDIPVYPGSGYVMDRGYVDFLRLHQLHAAGAFFVTRLKSGIRYYVGESRPVDKTVGLRCDQTIRLNSRKGRRDYPDPLRRISYVDPQSGQALVFLSNWFALEAFVVAQVYRRRWGIETFFRWLKQHLRLRGFFSNSPNGVGIQIWSALCAHLLVAIAKQRKNLSVSLYEILQIVSVSSLEQVPLQELFTKVNTSNPSFDIPKQLEINWS